MLADLRTDAIWLQMLIDAREWRKAHPDFARIINPNNSYKK